MPFAPSGSTAARRCGRCGGCPTTCRCRCFRRRSPASSPMRTQNRCRDAAAGAGGRRLPDRPAVAEGPPDGVLAREVHEGTRRRLPGRQPQERQAPRPLCRRGAGAAAAGQRQGRRLHDAGGRNRHRQYRGVAQGDGAVPEGSDGRPPDPGRGLYPEQPGTGDASGGAADVRPLPRPDRPRQRCVEPQASGAGRPRAGRAAQRRPPRSR